MCRLHLGEELEDLVALPFQTVRGLTPTCVIPPEQPRGPHQHPRHRHTSRQQRHPPNDPVTSPPMQRDSRSSRESGRLRERSREGRGPSCTGSLTSGTSPPLQGSRQQCPVSTTTCQPSTGGNITVSRPREGEVGAALPADTALTTTDCLSAGTVTHTTAVDHQGIHVAATRSTNWSLSSGSIHPSQTIKCWSPSETAAYSYLLVPEYCLDVAWSACLASVGPMMRLAACLLATKAGILRGNPKLSINSATSSSRYRLTAPEQETPCHLCSLS